MSVNYLSVICVVDVIDIISTYIYIRIYIILFEALFKQLVNH